MAIRIQRNFAHHVPVNSPCTALSSAHAEPHLSPFYHFKSLPTFPTNSIPHLCRRIRNRSPQSTPANQTRRNPSPTLLASRLGRKRRKYPSPHPSPLTLDGYIISLDSKPLRSPLGNTIVLPPRLSTLAYLIGAEWNVVTTGSVRQHTLPLTSLVCRAVDQLTPDTAKEIRGPVIESLLRYLDTDAVLFFAPESQAHGQLLRMQTEEWTPIIEWGERAFEVSIHSRSGEVGIGQFAKQPSGTSEKFREWMQTYSHSM